jgi:hypothetical protein
MTKRMKHVAERLRRSRPLPSGQGPVGAVSEQVGITSDTLPRKEALARDDNFGEWLVSQGGRLSSDFETGF